ncbi:hypothetical protein ACQP2T_40330 [Nonomuraea sp. CA-143628]|uniref:hypothetical protein n=1 Tax=Nonomuraea sp. CA-143628 TaxID=3239997 RepID=UPI003D92778A
MIHPLHRSFRLPATFDTLRAFVLDGFDPEAGLEIYEIAWKKCGSLLCGDLDAVLLDPSPDTSDPLELGYQNQPIEIVPFGRNGGDGLHYGWAVLAPEMDLDDHPCVSFAPVDDHAVWLGDTTKQALENLLVGSVAGWVEWGRAQGWPSPANDPRWTELCRALDLRPEIGSPEITGGARSSRAIRPTVPPGWRYEPTDDGIGVLAEAAAFAPVAVEVGPSWDGDEHIAHARELLVAGYAASALCVLKATYPEREVVQTMRDAYKALGRTLHVERAEAWLRQNP